MLCAGPKQSKSDNKTDIKVSKARIAALEALSESDSTHTFARETLNSVLDKHVLSAADRSFTTRLVLGVTQTIISLDEVIYSCVNNKSDIKRDVMVALRISTYELLYLEKEAHAAVYQGVELVKIVQPKAKGLANLVLHKIAKKAKEFPFGDPNYDMDAFCRIYAIPKWIAKLMIEDVGLESGHLLIASSNGKPPSYVFVNTIKTSVDEVFELFKSNKMEPEKTHMLCGAKLENCIRINKPPKLFTHSIQKVYKDGLFLIADSASQGVSAFSLLSSNKPKNILHVCSGKGNKTIMVNALYKNRWGSMPSMTVIDNDPEKMKILLERCVQFGIDKPLNYVCDARQTEQFLDPEQKFDNVLVDAPCSGLGTLRRHPEIKLRLTPEAIEELSNIQLDILTSAAMHVALDGYLTYSTCTVTLKENQQVVKNFLKTDIGQDFALIKLKTEDETRQFYRTQTMGGINDTHFAIQLVRKRRDNV